MALPTIELPVAAGGSDYVQVSVAARASGAWINPTGNIVQMAFKTSGDPVSGDFKTASWDTDATTDPDTYIARCLVSGVGGGGAAELAAGSYWCWFKMTASPEIPVRKFAKLVVT
jgi:hypothetical protein